MITLLKFFALCVLVVVAFKIAPVALGIISAVMSFALSLGMALAGLAAVGGFILVTALFALAPLWIPVLLFVGLIVLLGRLILCPAAA